MNTTIAKAKDIVASYEFRNKLMALKDFFENNINKDFRYEGLADWCDFQAWDTLKDAKGMMTDEDYNSLRAEVKDCAYKVTLIACNDASERHTYENWMIKLAQEL